MFSLQIFHHTQAVAPVKYYLIMFGTVFVFRIFIDLIEKIPLALMTKKLRIFICLRFTICYVSFSEWFNAARFSNGVPH